MVAPLMQFASCCAVTGESPDPSRSFPDVGEGPSQKACGQPRSQAPGLRAKRGLTKLAKTEYTTLKSSRSPHPTPLHPLFQRGASETTTFTWPRTPHTRASPLCVQLFTRAIHPQSHRVWFEPTKGTPLAPWRGSRPGFFALPVLSASLVPVHRPCLGRGDQFVPRKCALKGGHRTPNPLSILAEIT